MTLAAAAYLLLAVPMQVAAAQGSPPASAVATPTVAPPARRVRGELEAGLVVPVGASEWDGDPLAYGGLSLGFRLFRVVTPYVSGALGYARVDQRLLTRLTVGVAVGAPVAQWFYPRVYVAFVHQHEESLAALAQEPLGAVLGIGGGIRHRAGVHFGAALDVAVVRRADWTLTVGPDVSAMYLTYSSGPSWYVVAGALAAFHVRLF